MQTWNTMRKGEARMSNKLRLQYVNVAMSGYPEVMRIAVQKRRNNGEPWETLETFPDEKEATEKYPAAKWRGSVAMRERRTS
jgi:hypothetical protein